MSLENLKTLSDRFKSRTFQDECFLCGANLSKRCATREHVIPAWLQSRFDLWDKQLELLNGSVIPYRQLVIPCCRSCNSNYLAPIEEEVSSAISAGLSAIASLSETTLFQWLGKIFYGILYRELSLRSDRSDPASVSIIPQSIMHRYDLHHLFLQSSRIPFSFQPGVPASVFVFPVQVPNEETLQFDLRDDLDNLAIFLRLGDTGILASLQDGRAMTIGPGSFFQQYQAAPLHPLQFEELGARFFCWLAKLNRTPKFLISGGISGITVHQLPLAGLSRKPVFDRYEPKEYAHYLSAFTQIPLADLYSEPVFLIN